MTSSASLVAEDSNEISFIALTMPENGKSNFNHQRFIMLAEKEITLTVWKISPIRRNFIFETPVTQMSAKESNPNFLYIYDVKFVKTCADEFKWKDLSRDVVMNIGWGANQYCCKAILHEFPDINTLIAVDERVVPNQATLTHEKIQLINGNIQERQSLQKYEGKMNKVVSTSIFSAIKDKELAFRNVYRLLKPGGEAAVSFSLDSVLNEFLTAMLTVPKFEVMFPGSPDGNLYPVEHGKQYYQKMLERVGFCNVRSAEETRILPCTSDEHCRDSLYKLFKDFFRLPPEKVEEFKDDAFQTYVKTVGRHNGKPYYRVSTLNLFAVKPMEE
ncbi:hypothetical protein NPIL_440501 [Nephila pilipes]|uniref:Uncharacterized protein n=1 Tax=Nephila pilipes TaxID=299642 RepID=A0A8X6P6Y2_NEPPI|nr:hypothetical protein NPIL_440501 [Nephila pilipes]